METFFGVVILIILGFYILGKILKFAFKLWVARNMSKFGKDQSGDFDPFTAFRNFASYAKKRESPNNETDRREGEIKVTLTSEEPKKVKEMVGEYIDFDEVK